jgi:hypothetical protein
MIYVQKESVPELGQDFDFNLFSSSGAEAGATSAVAKTTDWGTVLSNIGKVVDIGAGLWAGAKSSDVQVAQLELAKAQAQTAAEAAKASQLIAATQAAQAKQAQPLSLATGVGIGIPLLVLGGLGVWFLLQKKR